MIDFPASPVVGQEFDAVGFTYIWNGQGWTVKPLVTDDLVVDAYNKIESDARYVDVTGDTMTGPLILSSGVVSVVANGSMFGKADGTGGNAAVTPADANILLYRLTDENWAGIGTDTAGSMWFRAGGSGTPPPALWISAADYCVNLANEPTQPKHAATKAYVDSKAATGAFLPLTGGTLTGNLTITPGVLSVFANQNTLGTADGTSAAGAVTPADANIKFYDSGAGSGNWAGIGCDTGGSMWFRTGNSGTPIPRFYIGAGGGIIFNTNTQFNYNLSGTSANFTTSINCNSFGATSSIYGNSVFFNNPTNDAYCSMYADGSHTILSLLSNWYFRMVRASGELYWICGNGQSFNLHTQGGCVASSDDCRKPTGGPWWSWSDARIKNVLGNFTRGLDAVTSLNPILCTFKGNDTKGPPESWQDMTKEPSERAGPPTVAPYVNSPHNTLAKNQKICVSVVAQDVLPVFPELIMKESGYIDGEPVSDLHVLDTGPLIYALVNSCKELKAMNEQLAARVAALEGAP